MAVERRLEGGDTELNLVPVMNLVSILIPFLLMAASFVNLAVIDSTLPAIGPPVQAELDPDEKPPLVLSVLITDKGLTIAGADAILNPDRPEGEPPPSSEEQEPTIPCPGNNCTDLDSYNFEELTRLLGLIKDEYPDDENVILVPESRIPYEILVKVMDSSREDVETKNEDGTSRPLFPYVVIAGGAE